VQETSQGLVKETGLGVRLLQETGLGLVWYQRSTVVHPTCKAGNQLIIPVSITSTVSQATATSLSILFPISWPSTND